MSNTRKFSLLVLSVAAGVAACSRGNSTAQTSDFASDLQLAQSGSVNLATPKVDPSLLNSALEMAPRSAPQAASTLRKSASGNQAVHANAPTRRAAPTADPAAAEESTPEFTTVAQAPAPDISEPVAVAPRPGTGPNPGAGDASGDYGTSGNGGGIFGPGGGMGGVVMRGGGADGDHCDPPGGRRTGGRIYIPGPAYPTTGGSIGGIGRAPRSSGSTGTRRGTTTVSRPGTIGTRGRRG